MTSDIGSTNDHPDDEPDDEESQRRSSFLPPLNINGGTGATDSVSDVSSITQTVPPSKSKGWEVSLQNSDLESPRITYTGSLEDCSLNHAANREKVDREIPNYEAGGDLPSLSMPKIGAPNSKSGAVASTAGTASPPSKRLPSDKLNFSDLGVYGRDTELDILDECWEEITEGQVARQLLLMSGNSGTGKSRLAESIRERTNKNNGIYARGKFDLNQRNQPYTGIACACEEICGSLRALRMHDLEKYSKVCLAIKKEVGEELSLLSQVFPIIEEIIDIDAGGINGDHNRKGDESTNDTSEDNDYKSFGVDAEAYNQKFVFAFQRFFRVITSNFCPLVIVLDDLQWSDGASLDLIEALLSDHQNSKLFVIGIYRSEEVDESHFFSDTLESLEMKSEEHDFDLASIEIEELDVNAVHEILKDLLGIDNENTKTLMLAQTCMRKTGGNVFFLLQFLKMLEESKILKYDVGAGQWKWDNDEIEFKTKTHENVEELLKEKITKLPADLIRVLKLAACLGSNFDLKVLSVPWKDSHCGAEGAADKNKDIEILTLGLKELEKQSFIQTVSVGSKRKYNWVHDKIHEASLSMIRESDRNSFALKVGESLHRELEDDEVDENIFIITNLMNMAEDWPTEEERMEVAYLNLTASNKAMSIAAFGNAAEYAGYGIDLLPDNPWMEYYEVALQLYSIGAKSESFIGNTNTMDSYCNIIFSLGDRPIEDKLDAYNTWVNSLMNQGRVNDSQEALMELLKGFQCRFPKNPAMIGLGVMRGTRTMKSIIRSFEKAKLIKMTDKRKIETMKLMSKLFGVMYVLQDQRMLVVIFRQLQWILKFGYSDNAPVVLATLAVISSGVTGDQQLSTRYGEQALEILSKTNSLEFVSQTYFPVYSMVFPWTKPLDNLLKPLWHGYSVGMKTGDTEGASWAIFHWILFKYMLGTPLQELASDMLLFAYQMKSVNRMQTFKMLRVLRQAFLNLLGADNTGNPTRLCGISVTEQDLKHDEDDIFQVAFTITVQGLLYTYCGEHIKQADLVYQHGAEYLFKIHMSSPSLMFDAFLKGVSCYAAAQQTGKHKYIKHGDFFMSKLKTWYDKGNPNVKHHYMFLEAESTALKGKYSDAIKQYQEVISTSERGGYHQDVALANERLADLHLMKKDTDEAIYRYKEALKFWKSWGASAKIESLQRKHSVVLGQDTSESLAPSSTKFPSSKRYSSFRFKASNS